MHMHTHYHTKIVSIQTPSHMHAHTHTPTHMQVKAVTCVDFHVGAQVDGLGELAATHITGVRHDCGVGQQVAPQAAHLAK